MSTKQERNSTFEILRLILMFMIVIEHSLMVLTLHNYEPLSVIDNISWFIQTYIVLAILSPYIIKGLKTLSQKAHLTLICILLIFFSIHQIFIKVNTVIYMKSGALAHNAVILLERKTIFILFDYK